MENSQTGKNIYIRKIALVLGGAGLGAVAAALFDPVSGARRRALIRDQWVRIKNDTFHRLGKTRKDLRNRLEGLAAKTSRITKSEVPDDQILIERIRSKFGRKVSHPK